MPDPLPLTSPGQFYVAAKKQGYLFTPAEGGVDLTAPEGMQIDRNAVDFMQANKGMLNWFAARDQAKTDGTPMPPPPKPSFKADELPGFFDRRMIDLGDKFTGSIRGIGEILDQLNQSAEERVMENQQTREYWAKRAREPGKDYSGGIVQKMEPEAEASPAAQRAFTEGLGRDIAAASQRTQMAAADEAAVEGIDKLDPITRYLSTGMGYMADPVGVAGGRLGAAALKGAAPILKNAPKALRYILEAAAPAAVSAGAQMGMEPGVPIEERPGRAALGATAGAVLGPATRALGDAAVGVVKNAPNALGGLARKFIGPGRVEKAAEILEKSKEIGANPTIGEVIQSPGMQRIEQRVLDQTPGLPIPFTPKWGPGYRQQEADTLLNAAQGFVESQKPAGLGTKNVAEQLQSGMQGTYNRVRANVRIKGQALRKDVQGAPPVFMGSTRRAIRNLMDEMKDADPEIGDKDLARKLQSLYTSRLAKGGEEAGAVSLESRPLRKFEEVWSDRINLGDELDRAVAAKDKSKVRALTLVKNSYDQDIKNWAASLGRRGLSVARRVDDLLSYYQKKLVPLEESRIARFRNATEPEEVALDRQVFLKDQPNFSKRFLAAVDDPKLRQLAKYSQFEGALSKATKADTGNFVPSTFERELAEIESTVPLTPKVKSQLRGLRVLIQARPELSRFSANPPTGIRQVELLTYGAPLLGSQFDFTRPAVGWGLAGLDIMRALDRSTKLQTMLVNLAKMKPGTPVSDWFAERAAGELTRELARGGAATAAERRPERR